MPKPAANSADADVLADAVVPALAESYGLLGARLTFLGGELDRNYRVSAADGRTFLAKVHEKADSNDRLRWQKEILLHVADRHVGVGVPTLVRTVDGDLDVGIDVGSERWLLTVLDWVRGTDMVHVASHSEGLLVDIGAAAARVTKALEGFRSETLPETHHWDVTRSAEVIDECLAADPTLGDNPDILVARRWFTDVEPRLDSLPRAMVHNDLNDNNVLVDTVDGVQKVAGVLDFNDALYTVRVAEPAIAGAYAMLRKDDPLTAMGFIVSGYCGVIPLTDDELAVAYPLAAARLCVQALTWAVRGRVDPTDYGAMRMRHTLPALHRVLQVDTRTAAARLAEMSSRRRRADPHDPATARRKNEE
jgi:Ser/Thr protein kinase RdoA (MazF antagonist)